MGTTLFKPMIDNGDTASPRFWGPSRRKLFWLVLASKLVFFGVAITAIELFPAFNLREYKNDLHWPRDQPPTLATHFATWDGAHYLLISEIGYERGSPSCAFYPLWPYLIRGFAWLTIHDHFGTGLILANALSIAAFLLFHYFVEAHHGQRTADASLALLVAYPAALYFSLIYTESLFLFLSIVFFLFLFRDQFFRAAVVGFFLPLTKAVGLFCLFPLLYYAWHKRKSPNTYLAFYGPALGYGCYFFTMYCATGNAFEGFQAQEFFPNQPSIAHIFDLPSFLLALFRPLSLHGMQDSAIDRGLFLLLIGSLYRIYRLNPVYFVYACLVGVIPALSSWFLSYTRNLMMCFPLFILYGTILAGPERRPWLWAVLTLMAAVQVWFLLRYINFNWVA